MKITPSFIVFIGGLNFFWSFTDVLNRMLECDAGIEMRLWITIGASSVLALAIWIDGREGDE